jgi:hypothetical protein
MDGPGANAASFDQLLYAGVANTYQSKFSRYKEGIGCKQQEHPKKPEQGG